RGCDRIDPISHREPQLGVSGDIVRRRIRRVHVVVTAGPWTARVAARIRALRIRVLRDTAVGEPDRLIAVDAVVLTGGDDTEQHAERIVKGVRIDAGQCGADLFVDVRVRAFRREAEVLTGIVERTHRAQVDVTGRAALEMLRGRRLGDGETAEKLGREDVEIDFAVRVRAGQVSVGSHGDVVAVEDDLREAGPKAAHGDLLPLARHVTVDFHARNAIDRFGEVLA